jgi:hypothetical protein
VTCLSRLNEMNSEDLPRSNEGKAGQLADEVLDYMLRHPEAQDTVEGIAEWWLLERRVTRVVEEVKMTLIDLVGKDFLVAERSRDGRIHYKLNRDKAREIRRYLRNRKSKPATTGASIPDN